MNIKRIAVNASLLINLCAAANVLAEQQQAVDSKSLKAINQEALQTSFYHPSHKPKQIPPTKYTRFQSIEEAISELRSNPIVQRP